MATTRLELQTASADSNALDSFACGDPPAFATDAWHRITLWNAGAERLLKRRAEEVLGKPCFEVIRGRDVFGNRFCYEKCGLHATLRQGEAARAFDLVVHPSHNGGRKLSITTVQIQGRSPGHFTLIHILREAVDGRRSEELPTGPCGQPASDPAAPPAAAPALEDPPLTPREKVILRCIASGLQNKEIAERLDISLSTARNHIHNILGKLQVHSKLEAASLAYRRGWVGAREA